MITEKYYQFPLSALSYGISPQETMQAIQAYCVANMSSVVHEKYRPAIQTAITETIDENKDYSGIDYDNPKIMAIMSAIRIMDIQKIDVENSIKISGEIMQHLIKQHNEHGQDALVRIRADIFEDALCGVFKYRDFAVLCGIYAILGDKQYAKISRDRIIAAAMGFKSSKIMPQDCNHLTTQQLRDSLDRLESANLIRRFCPNRRHAYFSNRLSIDSLRLLVGRRIVDKEKSCKRNRANDIDFIRKLRDE